jgi:cis-3-alkyl-4-acyloxetan-2-one decarboxylase
MTYDTYPFESRFVTVDSQRMHYVDEGRGETLLLLHGNPTWSYLYRHIIADLSKDHRCVAPDHVGFGFSDKPRNGDYSMRAHIMRLGAFVDEIGLDDITLVAQDWGGIIGLAWAVHHKVRVRRLVLMNTTGFLPERPADFARMRPVPWGLLLLWAMKVPGLGEAFVQGANGFARRMVPLGIHHRERMTPSVMRGYLDPYPTWSSRRAHLEAVRQVPLGLRHPTRRLLQEIGAELDGWRVPAQLIWGMRDPVFVPWFLEEFERRLPNHAPSVRIEDASHFLQDDRPDIIGGTIRRFVHDTAPARTVEHTAGPRV